MTVFWIVAALFVGGALLMMLPALLAPRAAGVSARGANIAVHRDQWRELDADLAAGLISPERHAQAKAEIERRIVEDAAADDALSAPRPARRTALALGVAVPLASVAIYLALGSPHSAAPSVAQAPAAGGQRHALTPEQIQQMVTALAERLKANPNDAEGWLMLARSYTVLGRYRDAVTAMRRANDLVPNNPSLLADLADLVGMAQNKRLAGEPATLIQKALDIDPRHVKALALAGTVSFEQRDYGAARGYWERLAAVLPPDSPMLKSVQGSILEATQLEGGAAPSAAVAQAPAQAPAQPAAAAGPAAVAGEVAIAPALAAKLAPGDTLFVFARAAEGPRMPLAILRQPAGALPVAFRLDDSMAMAPNMKLSSFKQVVVGARISRTGNATPQSGDLTGLSAVVSPGAQGVKVVIDQVQP